MEDDMSGTEQLEPAGEALELAEPEINPVMHLIAPMAAIAATIVIRKLVNTAYEKSTGHAPPLPRDPRVPLMRAILWTAVITTTAAVAEVAVYRLISRIGERNA
jgi:hypothetical protein